MKILIKCAGVLLVAAVGLFSWQALRLSPDLELGSASPEVTLAGHDGPDLPVASLRGKLVLLDFWSST